MSQLDDAIAAGLASANDEVTRNAAFRADQKAKVDALQAMVDSGGATPQNLADLASLKAILDGLDPTNPTTLPPTPPTPPAPPAGP